ncbi:hypothetical protein [Dyadobacter sp. 32]|uniref:hypothetical protein n=1 Tax=Dyadobacter sp. 32 TaxID=538966 RepID=UPI0011EFAFF1
MALPFLLVLLLAFSHAWGQSLDHDLIVRYDSVSIECEIVRVTTEVIRYKKQSYAQGPVFQVLTSDVSKIIYKNGNTEDFSLLKRPVKKTTQSPPKYPSGPWLDRDFTENMAARKAPELIKAKNFYDAKARSNKVMAITMGALSTVMAAAGTHIFINAKESVAGGTYINQGNRRIGSMLMILGAGSGVGLGTSGLFSFKKYKSRAQLVDNEISNRKASSINLFLSPQCNYHSRDVSLSLVVNF